MSPLQKFGLRIEDQVANLFRQAGYDYHQPSDFFSTEDGILAGYLPVFVKAANRRQQFNGKRFRGRYFFNFKNVPTDREGLIVCVACTWAGPVYFFIPVSAVSGRHKLSITSAPSSYSGWAAEYRGDMSQAQKLLSRSLDQADLPLFHSHLLEVR